jgi:hypothetical protein
MLFGGELGTWKLTAIPPLAKSTFRLSQGLLNLDPRYCAGVWTSIPHHLFLLVLILPRLDAASASYRA